MDDFGLAVVGAACLVFSVVAAIYMLRPSTTKYGFIVSGCLMVILAISAVYLIFYSFGDVIYMMD